MARTKFPKTLTTAPAPERLDPATGGRHDPMFWPLAALFAASGCSALIYEIVWFQILELVVGSSAISLGILLGTYMGGMCAGSWLLPRVIPSRFHPVRVYGVIELGIAALAMLVLLEVPLVGAIYRGSGWLGPWGIVIQAAIAGVCLVPPTLLMGATLPAVARWVKATPGGAGWLGFLYGSNIVGGIFGCLVAGFYLLRVFDTTTATAVAAALNLVVAGGAFLLARRVPHRPAEAASSPDGRASATIYLAIAISGCCALGGEVVWTRLLALLLGPTVYTFSIILAVFLTGLGLGSGIGAALARSSPHPRRDLGVCQALLMAAIAWAAFTVSASLPYWPIAPELSRNPWISFELDLVRCIWALLPAATIWGASFPLAIAAAAGPGRDSGRLVAGIYAVNTVGAILGALGFTFLVVPSFGTQVAQQALIALTAAGALALLGPAALPPWRRMAPGLRAAVALIAVLFVAVGLVRSVPRVPSALIALGRNVAFRLGAPDLHGDPYHDPHILYTGEGLTESVVVSTDGRVRVFHVSGKIEASTSEKDMRLQRMLGHIPALVHGAPRSVLVVGCGAGVTAGAFVTHPSVQRIVICEIEPLVPKKVAPYFREQNHDVLSDPRVEIVYDDARHFLLTTREKFDVITSDPIHPWVKGSAALYSRDYFDLVRRHLNPGGVVSQWVPLYQASEPTVKGEMATFFSVFPNGTVWANNDQGRNYDLVMLGTDGPTVIDLDSLRARLDRPDYARVLGSLRSGGFPSETRLLSTYAGRNTDLKPWLAGAQINLDQKPWLQYQAGMESYVEQTADVIGAIAPYRRFPEDVFVGSEEHVTELKTEAEEQ